MRAAPVVDGHVSGRRAQETGTPGPIGCLQAFRRVAASTINFMVLPFSPRTMPTSFLDFGALVSSLFARRFHALAMIFKGPWHGHGI